MAATSAASMGAITYQRKLDLATIAAPEPPRVQPSGLDGDGDAGWDDWTAAAAAPTAPADMSERYECSLPALGWWCLGAQAAPTTLRGRIVFGPTVVDALLGSPEAPSGSSGLAGRKAAGIRGREHERSAGAAHAFFAGTRAFFDPSLPAPRPPRAVGLAARAAEVAALVSVEAEAEAEGGGLEWRSPPASLVVVSADPGGVVLAFAAVVAGPGAAFASVLISLPLPGAPLRLGPFPIHGGDIDCGQLTV